MFIRFKGYSDRGAYEDHEFAGFRIPFLRLHVPSVDW